MIDLAEYFVKSAGMDNGWRNLLIRSDNELALKSLLELKGKGLLCNSDGSSGARLVYIDPPFATRLQFKSKDDEHAYSDKLAGKEYVEFMRTRLMLLKELLSDDGSIYVHLDWKMAHHIKVLMDEVFGRENFLNDIIWSYGGRGAKAVSGQFSRNHDIILYYRKGERHVFNRQYVQKSLVKSSSGIRQDKDGRWFKTAPRGDYTDESIARLEEQGRVHRTKNNKIRIKYFLDESSGGLVENKPVGDVWDDIPDAMHMGASEKTGYPTQKPEPLLWRIIGASTNEGDLVLDAFCGSGTTLVSAEKMGRRWAGIDSGSLAVKTCQDRLSSLSNGKDPRDPSVKFTRACSDFSLMELIEKREKTKRRGLVD